MNSRLRLLLVVAGMGLASSGANAGMYTDDLSRCLVDSTTSADKLTLVKWMFAAMARHPAVKALASVSDAQMDAANKQTAELFVKLVTNTCKVQTQKAVKYEGQAALQASFQVFGQVAAAELFSNPDVAAGMSGLTKYFDNKKLSETLGISQ
jgi:hypothetical protein